MAYYTKLVFLQPPSAKASTPAKAPSPAPTKAPSPANGIRPSRSVKGNKVAPAPEEEAELKKVEKKEEKKQVEIANGGPADRAADGNWEPVREIATVDGRRGLGFWDKLDQGCGGACEGLHGPRIEVAAS